MKSKYDKWLIEEVKTWEEMGLADFNTIEKIQNYYTSKGKTESSRLGAILGTVGSVLIGLGIVLILAKNWSNFPRGAKVVISLLPFIIGSFGGMVIVKRGLGGWLKEAAALFTVIGIVTAVVMNGQIYHIIADEWLLFFVMAVLALPLIYVYDSVPALGAYLLLGIICMFMTDLIGLGIKASLGTVILAGGIPYVIKHYRKDKLSLEAGWANTFIILASFAFITSLAENSVLLRELYITYFIFLISLDRCLYGEAAFLNVRPYAILGNAGFYMTLFVFTFSEFWRYASTRSIGLGHMTILSVILGVSFLMIIYLIKNKKAADGKLPVYLIAALLTIGFRVVGLLSTNVWMILPIVLNVIFAGLALITLREGILGSSAGKMNLGLLLLTALIIARFFDSEFSFLVKGIVFIICGIVFLAANLYLTKKRKKE